jgi:hypothetical protein
MSTLVLTHKETLGFLQEMPSSHLMIKLRREIHQSEPITLISLTGPPRLNP